MYAAGCERYSKAETLTQIAYDIRRGLLEAVAYAEGTADRALMSAPCGPDE